MAAVRQIAARAEFVGGRRALQVRMIDALAG